MNTMAKFIFLLIVSLSAAAANADEIYWLTVAGTNQRILIGLSKSIRVSAECLTRNPGCLALKKVKNPPQIPLEGGLDGFVKNQASLLCYKLKAESVILHDLKMNQHEFCRFRDGSLISVTDILIQDSIDQPVDQE